MAVMAERVAEPTPLPSRMQAAYIEQFGSADGRLRMRIAWVLPLSEARAAHHLVEGSGSGGQAGEKAKGRVVVVMRSTTGTQPWQMHAKL